MAQVLFVDDNTDLHRVMQTLLRFAGHDAVCLPSGEQALGYLKEQQPDVLLLDLMMPGLSGMDVLAAIRSDPGMGKLPVIIFSGISDEAQIKESLAAGANDFWVKGKFDFDELKVRLEQHIHPA